MLLTAAKTFITRNLFSGTGVFLLILASLIMFFVIINSNTILSKFGFETRTELKADLVKTQEELKQVIAINQRLTENIASLEKRAATELQVVTTKVTEQVKVERQVKRVIEDKKVKTQEVVKALEEKTVVTETEIVLPTIEYNKLSESNIDSIHAVFKDLFPVQT